MRVFLVALSVVLMAALMASTAQAVTITVFEDNFNSYTAGSADLPALATVGTWGAHVDNGGLGRGGRIDVAYLGSDGNVLLYHPSVRGPIILAEFTQPAVTGDTLHAEWDQVLMGTYMDSMLVQNVATSGYQPALHDIMAWTRVTDADISHLSTAPLTIPISGGGQFTWIHFEWDYVVGSDILALTIDGGTPVNMPFDWGWGGESGIWLTTAGSQVTQIEALQWRSFSDAVGRIDNVLVTVDLVPEPSTIMLLLAGTMMLLGLRRR